MSVQDPPQTPDDHAPAAIAFAPGERRFSLRRRHPGAPRPRVRKLRVLAVFSAFLVLAGISTLFGMLTAMASDLPQLENSTEFKHTVDTYLYDDRGNPIGVLAPPNKPVLDHYQQINKNMINAVVAVEDKTFWHSNGIDLHSLARAFLSDVSGGQREGASTIPEEFVKNVLKQEDNRTIFEKLREAGIAFELVHHWKPKKIITEYLNSIYFGNGGYGVESAARVYFGKDYGYSSTGSGSKTGCGSPDALDADRKECASMLDPAQAALLAAMVANPTAFDPIEHPTAARDRRDLVLRDMLEQGYLSQAQYTRAKNSPLPTSADIQSPQEPAAAPYFTAWVRPQIIRALEKEGVPKSTAQWEAYYGGLKINLTLDEKLQNAAQTAVDDEFPPGSNGPTASLVTIDNQNGEVRAMVSGDGDYDQSPFNLATLGYRQPGSSFKLFTLAAAISSGKYGPDSTVDSEPVDIPYTIDGRTYHYDVHNDEDSYLGPISLATATAVSDNSVFTQVGMSVGTQQVKHYAQLMGIRSPISTTPAMIIGGLQTGVSALDMAHAYSTEANDGVKVYNPILGDTQEGATGIRTIRNCEECHTHSIYAKLTNRSTRVLTPDVAATIQEMLTGPVDDRYGTGTAAAIPGVEIYGKTGTTSNYVDAWFCGWTTELTTCVWVGYPSSGKPMLTNFDGGPVEGGTYPAIIFHNYMENALQVLQDEADHKKYTATTTSTESSASTQSASVSTSTSSTNTESVTTQSTTGASSTTTPATGDSNGTEQTPPSSGVETTSAPTAGTGDTGAPATGGAGSVSGGAGLP